MLECREACGKESPFPIQAFQRLMNSTLCKNMPKTPPLHSKKEASKHHWIEEKVLGGLGFWPRYGRELHIEQDHDLRGAKRLRDVINADSCAFRQISKP